MKRHDTHHYIRSSGFARAIMLLCVLTLPFIATAGRPHQSVGLTLSGGGAKGIAHIGVIKALEDNGIPIDYVTGTSMGAIVGGLYASGYTPDEMMQLIESKGFSYWSTGRVDPSLTELFEQPELTSAFVNLNVGDRDSTSSSSILPSSLINPLPMSFAFMELFAGYTAQCRGDFNRLFVPFRCVTSDVYSKKAIICRSGSLGDAIRASMSFPVVFRPIEMDGVPVYDGGIYDNFPFDVMQSEFAPSFIIGVDVTTPSTKSPADQDMIDQLENMIMQPDKSHFPDSTGIRIHIKLSQFGLLDFDKAKEIYALGYDKAMEMMDSIKNRVYTRVPARSRTLRRDVFKSMTPYVRFDSVNITGGTPAQNHYLDYLFTKRHEKTDTFGLADAKISFYRAIAPGQISNFVPHALYNDTTGLFTLTGKASIKRGFDIGVGGFLTSSTNSYLFVSGGYNTLSFESLCASLDLWAGQSYLAAKVRTTLHLPTSHPSDIDLTVVGSRQKFSESEKLFFEENNPVFVTSSQLYTALSYSTPTSRRSVASISTGYGHLTDRYRSPALDDAVQHNIADLGLLSAKWDHNTLDDAQYPTAGSMSTITLSGVYGHNRIKTGPVTDERKTLCYWQAELSGAKYVPLGRKFALGGTLDVVASSRPLLGSYNASILTAPAFSPLAASYNAFNPAFSANSWGAVGLVPVWKVFNRVQLRGNFYGFLPYRKIIAQSDGTAKYGRRFSNPEFMGQLTLAATLPFATLSLYGNYMSYPARNWNCGISVGVYILAPRFLR